MANSVIAQLTSIFGVNYTYKQAIKYIKISGGRILKATATTVLFTFPDSSVLEIKN